MTHPTLNLSGFIGDEPKGFLAAALRAVVPSAVQDFEGQTANVVKDLTPTAAGLSFELPHLIP